MTRWKGVVRLVLLVSVVASFPMDVDAYEEATHEEISAAAARTPYPGYPSYSVIEVGASYMGFALGPDSDVRGQTVVQWMQAGATLEDQTPRFLNHFHNPLAQWSVAGLLQLGQSSVLWAQSSTGQAWAWSAARQHLHDALTKPTKDEREQALTRMLRALGQQMHLVQDAAVPAHTRNDPHPGWNYEKLIRTIQRDEPSTFAGWLQGEVWPDAGWSSLPADPQAPAGVARLIDTDRYTSTDAYTGVNPSVTAEPLIGLAEYTNANFLSEDSRWTSWTNQLFRPFAHPGPASVVEVDYDIQLPSGEVVKRKYYHKVANGDTGYRLGTVGFLRDYYVQYALDPDRAHHTAALDEMVQRDYAARLLPRAVGYSAALLEYFFRPYFWAGGPPEAFNVYNPMPWAMQGQVTVYAVLDDERRPLGGFAVEVPANSLSAQTYALPTLGPWPCASLPFGCGADHWVFRQYCLLVFRGQLGAEPDAVAMATSGCLYDEPPPPPPPVCPTEPCDGGA